MLAINLDIGDVVLEHGGDVVLEHGGDVSPCQECSLGEDDRTQETGLSAGTMSK